MMAANYRHIGGGVNRLGRHYSRFSGFWPTPFLIDQSLALRKSRNTGSNRPRRAKSARGRRRAGAGQKMRNAFRRARKHNRNGGLRSERSWLFDPLAEANEITEGIDD